MSVFDRPNSRELLDAVINYLNSEIKSDSYLPDKKFKLQIVLNILKIVKREIESGKEINEKYLSLGSELVGEDKFSLEKLSKKIRKKEIDYKNQSLIDFLYNLTKDKIEIDNPKYVKK